MRTLLSALYYGWATLAVGAVTEMLAQGSTRYAAILFFLPRQSEFHISRVDANSSILILFFESAIVAPFARKILDRYFLRLVILLCAVAAVILFGPEKSGKAHAA